MPKPVVAEVFIAINGKLSDVLARATITSEILADSELAALLHEVADEIERQTVNPHPEASDAEADALAGD